MHPTLADGILYDTMYGHQFSLFKRGERTLIMSLRKHLWLLGVVALIGLPLHTSVSAQTIVFQDTFDSELLGTTTVLSNWTVTAGNVDVIGPGFADLYPGNGNYLDMDGTCGSATIQSPSLNLSPGTYQLSFEIGNNPGTIPPGGGNNGLKVSLGTVFNLFVPAPATLTPISAQFVVATPTVASLVFQETGPTDCGGSVLDDVTLVISQPTVAIDIKPGSDPNSINPRSRGVIPVAILTTDTFDAATVDPTTVLFGATGTEVAPAHFALEDVDRDGDTDLILHFNTQQTGIQCGDTSATLAGETFSGQMIEGSDSIKTVGCK